MKEIEFKKIKEIELEILIFIDDFCKQNNLKYFLCGGTLIGAVRHEGFIPWDDDIDIFMPRPDYDKLISLFKENEKYKLLSPFDDGYYYNFAKVVDVRTSLIELHINQINNLGVYIDIFPLDGMPNGKDECIEHFNRLNKQRKKINAFSVKKPCIRKNIFKYFADWVYYFSCKFRKLEVEQKKYLDLAMKYKYGNSSKVYVTGGAYNRKDIFCKDWIIKGKDFSFEGKKFIGPTDYDKYLRQLYGDYMRLPPKEEQKSHHNFKAFWKE